MVSLRTSTAAIALSSLVLLCGCQGERVCSPPCDEFLCYALALQVPDSIDAGRTIDAVVSGVVGYGCVYLNRIESEAIGRKWVLHPTGCRGEPPEGTVCIRDMVCFERTVRLAAPDTGWIYVEVQSRGPVLVDTTYVRP